jgi:predicted RNase H-like HicB family nuclease
MATSASEEQQAAVEYTVVMVRSQQIHAARVPELPGCVATAESHDDLLAATREADGLHVESLRAHDEPGPEPRSTIARLDVAIKANQ